MKNKKLTKVIFGVLVSFSLLNISTFVCAKSTSNTKKIEIKKAKINKKAVENKVKHFIQHKKADIKDDMLYILNDNLENNKNLLEYFKKINSLAALYEKVPEIIGIIKNYEENILKSLEKKLENNKVKKKELDKYIKRMKENIKFLNRVIENKDGFLGKVISKILECSKEEKYKNSIKNLKDKLEKIISNNNNKK